jgi:hypothetical protein
LKPRLLEPPPQGGAKQPLLLAPPPSSPEPLLPLDDPLGSVPKVLLLLLPQAPRMPAVAPKATNPKTAHLPGLSLLNRIIEILVRWCRGAAGACARRRGYEVCVS